jgi:N-acyl-D-amino-acid deacylase
MDFDLLIRNADVYPGEGLPRRADVGVSGDRIAALELSLAGSSAALELDGDGMMLCPGFVDMHAHTALHSLEDPLLVPKIAQGFTTELINPDGLPPAPVAPDRRSERQAYIRGLEGSGPEEWPWTTFDEYLEWLEGTRPATTLVPSIGHNSVRDLVTGGEKRAPTADELAAMRHEVRLGFEAGARTLSFGLLYLPGAYADTDELVEFAKEAAPFGAPLVPHIRNEGLEVLEAVGEFLEVSRRSGAPLHVSHLKCFAGEALLDPLLELLDEASADVEVSFDQYPYGAGSTVLAALLPAWAQEGGASGTLARIADPDERARMTRDIEHGLPGSENILRTCGADRIVIANAGPPNEAAAGKSLTEIATERDTGPVEAIYALLSESALDVTMVLHYATDDAVRKVARHRLQLVGSDGIFGAKPHPRLYGTAPRFLGRFAIRDGLIPVEEAVARLTARAAKRLGLTDRGRIEPGKRADLVLLDPVRYVDAGTYESPAVTPDGVVGVWVAGEAVWRDGRATGARPGGVVREALPRT